MFLHFTAVSLKMSGMAAVLTTLLERSQARRAGFTVVVEEQGTIISNFRARTPEVKLGWRTQAPSCFHTQTRRAFEFLRCDLFTEFSQRYRP